MKWVGFDIPNEFVVGYGLDYAEKYRNLPFVGTLAPARLRRLSSGLGPVPPPVLPQGRTPAETFGNPGGLPAVGACEDGIRQPSPVRLG